MKRKVSLHGPSTLTVSLPANWVKKYGIKKGDELEVEQRDGSLLISTQKNLQFNEKEIDISELHPLIKRTMMKIYQEGYDEVKVNFDKPELIKNVQEVLNQFIGFEIIKQNKNSCLIKDISGSSSNDFDSVFRRVFLLLKEIFEDGQKAFEEKDRGLIKNLIYRDLEINKITNFCLRVLNKKNLIGSEGTIYFTILHNCEKIGDGYKRMLENYLEGKIKVDLDFIKRHEEIVSFFNEIYNFTFDRNRKGALKIASTYEKIRKKNSVFKNILDWMIFIQELQLSRIKGI